MAHPIAAQRLPVAPRKLVAGVKLVALALLGMPAGQPLILSVGRFSPEKRMDVR